MRLLKAVLFLLLPADDCPFSLVCLPVALDFCSGSAAVLSPSTSMCTLLVPAQLQDIMPC